MPKRTIKAICVVLALGLSPVPITAGTPEWLRSLAEQRQKKYAEDVDAVVLLDEGETSVRDNGEIVTHARIAYRILRPQGKRYAELELPFDNETRINSVHGWSITAKGQEYEAKDKDLFERSLTTYEVFSDEKAKMMLLPGADTGTVVAFEYERKARPYLFQQVWWTQAMVPVERSRYTLHLPTGWEYRADWINHPDQKPVEQGNTYTWEVTDVPRIERENHEPSFRAMASAIVITFFSEKIKNQTFKSWNDLGVWYAQLIAGTRDPSPALQQKAQELAPASLPMFERIKALAAFAQRDVRYAAIEIGIGGYRPHPAAEVLAHRYGDCKDKATVLSAMLSQIGVKSYLMLVHVQRGVYTEKTPPNPGFNHAILAIQLPEASYIKPLPAVYEHRKLGHMLIFDPTNDVVPLGQLPFYEQDNFGLLVTDNGGELIHLPVSRPENNQLRRNVKTTLLPDGTLQGEVEEVTSGYRAAIARESWKDRTEKDRKKVLERILGATLGSLQVDDLSVANDADIEKDFVLRYKFTADHYAKNAGPLLLVRPRVVGEYAGYIDPAKPRHYAYELGAPYSIHETVEITLPDGYKVDDLPEPVRAAVPFAEYTSKTEQAGNILKYTRDYKMTTTLVPVEKIEDLKKVFAAINVDENSKAVLKRVN